MPKATCSSCAREVQRNPRTSRPEIVCNPCRRASPKYQQRKQREANRQPLPEPARVACIICGETFQQGNGRQKYCSLRCRNRRPRNYTAAGLEHRRELDRERDRRRPKRPPRGRLITKPCERCGQPFTSRQYAQVRFCSRQCVGAMRPRRPMAVRIYIPDCKGCGRPFVTRRPSKVTCSAGCYNKTRPGRRGPHCEGCGADIPPQRKRCDDCLAVTRRERRRRDRARSRARRLRIQRERYTLAEIARRDGYLCGLCPRTKRKRDRRVDMTKVAPHPKAPTIDHVVPLDCGGDDTKANVQLAHFLCNSRKGNRGGAEQLRLVG